MTEMTSQIIPEKYTTVSTILNHRTKRMYRRRGFSNLLKMGHCAPSVMQTLQDLRSTKEDWLVRMTAGLPGGIGNTGFECGGITAPLIHFGLKHGLSSKYNGLPTVIHAGHDYFHLFHKCNNSLLCRDILGKRRVPLPCIKVARYAPELYSQTGSIDNTTAISSNTMEAFHLLYSHLCTDGFHCAHSVLKHLSNSVPFSQEVFDATSGFIGGTAFKGLTCSALTAGIMSVGLKLGEIEDSYFRVVRMLLIMILGGNAFVDHLNKFNRLMNIGNRMSKWFKKEFGSTLCHEVTQCDFSSLEDVNRYIKNGSLTYCKIIADKVAMQAKLIIERKGVGF